MRNNQIQIGPFAFSVNLRVHSSVRLCVKKSVNQLLYRLRIGVGFSNTEDHEGVHTEIHKDELKNTSENQEESSRHQHHHR